MAMIYTVPLRSLTDEFHFEVVYMASDYDKVCVTVEDVTRPGLQMAGYFDHFEPMRLQIFGIVEMTYLQRMPHEERERVLDRFFSYRMPAVIVARSLEILPEFLASAEKYDVSVLRGEEKTSALISDMISTLKLELAPRATRHGVLVDVYGEGVLLCGDSGIGKSEAAIELMKRGHRMVADDAVEIRKLSNTRLNGTAPSSIRHYVELRGIGIVNVARLFGTGSVRDNMDIDLVINIVPWEEGAAYDRMGLEEQYADLLGVRIPSITVPVTPGRNLAVIIEVAAMNNRQKKMGYNAAAELAEQLNASFNTRL